MDKMNIDYSRYLAICKGAINNDEIFERFKSYPDYIAILEHVTYQQGLEYLEYIKQDWPYLLDFMKKFAKNDEIGNPRKFWYEDINMNISPTTLRYVKVLADLVDNFGRLDNMDIIEIGCGYGGQCAIIHEFSEPKSYTLVDLPEILSLADRFLRMRNIWNVILKTTEDNNMNYDLCISNYAFTELDRKYQEMYVENIIKKSHRGYITCNYFGQRTKSEAMSKDEILVMKSDGRFIPEKPLTAPNNLIYIWGK